MKVKKKTKLTAKGKYDKGRGSMTYKASTKVKRRKYYNN